MEELTSSFGSEISASVDSAYRPESLQLDRSWAVAVGRICIGQVMYIGASEILRRA